MVAAIACGCDGALRVFPLEADRAVGGGECPGHGVAAVEGEGEDCLPCPAVRTFCPKGRERGQQRLGRLAGRVGNAYQVSAHAV